MTELHLVSPESCYGLVLTLLHSLWQVAAVVVFLRLLDAALASRSVSVRYSLHVVGLLACLIALPITFALVETRGLTPPSNVAERPLPQRESRMADESNKTIPFSGSPRPATSPDAASRSSATPADATLAETARGPWRAWSPWLAAAYLLGVAAMLSRLAMSVVREQRKRLQAKPISAGPLFEALQKIARQWSLRTAPLLAQAEDILVPQVVGLFKPTILLPVSMATGFDSVQIEMILAHELAHVRRLDMWANLLQRLGEVLLFFNPALWYLSRRTSALREYCCDEQACALASQAVDNPQDSYAAALLRVVEQSLAATRSGQTKVELTSLAVSGRRPSELRRRVARLFGEPLREPLWLTRGGWATLLGALVALALPTAWNWSGSYAEETPDAIAEQAAEAPSETESPVDPQQAQRTQAVQQDFNQPNKLSIQVFDGGRKPIADVAVSVYRWNLLSSRTIKIAAGKTNAAGELNFDSVIPLDKSPWREAYADGQALEPLSQFSPNLAVVYSKPGFASTLDVRPESEVVRRGFLSQRGLQPAAAITGRVTDPQGEPVAGAWVGSSPAWRQLGGYQSATTNEQGEFEIRDLQPVDHGDDWSILKKQMAEHRRKQDEWRTRKQQEGEEDVLFDLWIGGPMTLSVVHPDYAERVVPYERAPGRVAAVLEAAAAIKGRVLTEDSNQPAVGIVVQAVGHFDKDYEQQNWRTRQPGQIASTVTDEQGRYRFDNLRPGEYWIRAVDKDWFNPANLRTFSAIEAVAGETSAGPELVLRRGVEARAQLVDAETSQPIEFSKPTKTVAHLVAEPGEKGTFFESKQQPIEIRPNGAFRLRIPPGKWGLHLEVNDRRHVHDGARYFDITGDQDDVLQVPMKLIEKQASSRAQLGVLVAADTPPWVVDVKVGDYLMRQGKYKEAVSSYERALSKNARLFTALNNLAFLFATCPDDDIRDGARAVEFAERAMEAADQPRAELYDTLAAALAERGDFEQAIEAQNKAIDLSNEEQQQEFKDSLELYRSGRPRRMQGKPAPDESSAKPVRPNVYFTARVVDDETGQSISKFQALAGTSRMSGFGWQWQDHTLHEFQEGRLQWPPNDKKGYQLQSLRIEAPGYEPFHTPPIKRLAEGEAAAPAGATMNEQGRAVSNLLSGRPGEPATLEIRLRRDPGVVGRVVDSQGEPVADARVLVAMAVRTVWIGDGTARSFPAKANERPRDAWRRARETTTDIQGEFRLPMEIAPAAVVAAHERGVAVLNFADVASQGEIRLQPWGRVEGKVQWGEAPADGQKISFSSYGARGKRDWDVGLMVHCFRGATSDSQGRFVFDRVPPGHATLSLPNSHPYQSLEVAAGKPTEFVFGGRGRPVIGRLVGLEDWRNARIRFAINAPRPGDMFVENGPWPKYQAFLNSPAGKRYSRGGIRVEEDGSFRIEGVPAERYQLFVDLLIEGRRTGNFGYKAFRVETPASGESTQPLDLGEIQVRQPEPSKSATPGPITGIELDAAPNEAIGQFSSDSSRR